MKLIKIGYYFICSLLVFFFCSCKNNGELQRFFKYDNSPYYSEWLEYDAYLIPAFDINKETHRIFDGYSFKFFTYGEGMTIYSSPSAADDCFMNLRINISHELLRKEDIVVEKEVESEKYGKYGIGKTVDRIDNDKLYYGRNNITILPLAWEYINSHHSNDRLLLL